jgi:hypothetical protein
LKIVVADRADKTGSKEVGKAGREVVVAVVLVAVDRAE